MLTLTKEAREYLDGYIEQLRACLFHCRTTRPDDIVAEALEQIQNELLPPPEPISLAELKRVMTRFGPPRRWVPMEDLPPWRRVAYALHEGPEGYRLAYIGMGMFLAGLLTAAFFGPVAVLLGPVYLRKCAPSAILLVGAFFFSRAALAAASERQKGSGGQWLVGQPRVAQKWVIYPPLMPVSFWMGVFTAFWPAVLVAHATGLTGGGEPARRGAAWLLALAALGFWWVALGLLALLRPLVLQTIFRPFAEWLNRRWAKRITIAGAVMAVLCGVLYLALGG